MQFLAIYAKFIFLNEFLYFELRHTVRVYGKAKSLNLLSLMMDSGRGHAIYYIQSSLTDFYILNKPRF